MRNKKGFTLVELMVVIMIVGILAAVAIPLMRGRIDSAKWSEANSAAGTIRTSIRAYFAEDETAALALSGAVTGHLATLGFDTVDLTGTYFNDTLYNIDSVSTDGIAVITVSPGTGLSGTYTLALNGDWVKN